MKTISDFIIQASDFIWGTPLMLLLVGGGLFLFLYSGLIPFRYFRHAIGIMQGKYDKSDAPGDISHYQALAGAISATVGLGNISGVAVAIMTGGPGAIFWMWVCALVGMATKFFECTLAIMYRGKDSLNRVQGGPMYYIEEGMGARFKPLAIFFSTVGLIGCLPLFTANQLTETIRNLFLIPNDLVNPDSIYPSLTIGIMLAALVTLVIFGGIQRIGDAAGSLFPVMVFSYLGVAIYVLIANWQEVPHSFGLIFSDAFTGNALLGGAVGTLIITGVRRAAFSNEAGLGTSPMMHGAAKTTEPIREGLVAMLGPFVDTIVVCTITALIIILSGVWKPQIGSHQSLKIEIKNKKNSDNVYQITMIKEENKQKDLLTIQVDGIQDKFEAKKQADSIILYIPDRKIIYEVDNSWKGIPILISQDINNHTLSIKEDRKRGISITAWAINQSLPHIGVYILLFCALIFGLTTLFSYYYYSTKCFNYLFGAENENLFKYIYILSIIFASMSSVTVVISTIDLMYALMAIPNLIAVLYLAPKVKIAAKDYFKRKKMGFGNE